ncbi:MAG TPA: carbonic anhydrase family protein [Chloroflexota bacterium]|nr:carbonic anhydrase family protein [Chloroflexota bacterium]
MDFKTRRRPSHLVAAVSRRKFLAWTGIATSALAAGGLWRPALTAFGQPAAQPAVWNHDPESPIGPSRWAEIGYPICGSGMSQSPINIDTRAVRTQSGPALGLSYQDSPLEIENTGHVVEVEIPSDITNSLSVGNDAYSLVQYHFHTPSEHTIDGQTADVEAHFVHMSASGATAVVGVLLQIGDNPNPVLETILRSASTRPGDTIDAGEANPLALFPGVGRASQVAVQLPTSGAVSAGFSHQANIESFYSYDGSLTTPGCTEGVRWFVLTDVGHVSSSAVDDLHHVISLFPDYGGYANNVRPVQPLNDRVVALRVAGG